MTCIKPQVNLGLYAFYHVMQMAFRFALNLFLLKNYQL
jgi:hypothetical protein